MKFTDIFIRRPVLATVVSLVILVFGIRAIYDLPVRQYPEVQSSVVKITTIYPGASAELIQGFITSPLQKSIASADGIDFMKADSRDGMSTIEAYITINFEPQEAFTNIMSKVSEVQGELPQESERPVVSMEEGGGSALMYISFDSQEMTPQQITDYVSRAVQPKLQTIEGVASADVFGGQIFSMRIWLDPLRMAAHNLTPAEVRTALATNNVQTAAGQSKGKYVATNILAKTDISDVDTFANIVIKSDNASMVRIQDIARVELGAESYNSYVTFDGNQSIFIGISATPSANPLSVITRVRTAFPAIQHDIPAALTSTIVYDATEFIRASIKEVVITILEATLIVVVVIFLFLGSLRSVVIPVIAIPLSLIGVCTLMLMLGYSINLLTLLAMVLAIGIVVDDAIIVVENVHRHIEEGMKPFNAAIVGAREIALPVIAMTITLAAVYAPIGFITGVTGALFKEFAFTLASAVVISGIVALTLSPMLCAKMLKHDPQENGFAQKLDRLFTRLQTAYKNLLHSSLNERKVVVIFAILIAVAIVPLYSMTKKESAPAEDIGFLLAISTAPEYATLDYTQSFTNQYNEIFSSFPETQHYFTINGIMGVNSAISGIVLKPWDQRSRSQKELEPLLTAKTHQIPGIQTMIYSIPSLPGSSGGLPFQFVITSTLEHRAMMPVIDRMVEAANNSGLFFFVRSSLDFSKPQTVIHIDRNKAADLGISMSEIAQVLGSSLSGATINRFNLEGRSYKVISQLSREKRLTADQLTDIHVKTGQNKLVPLSTIVTLEHTVIPSSLSQFQQLNSSTIEGVMRPGVSMGDAVEFMEQEAAKILPQGMGYDYSGETRQFKQESDVLTYAMIFSLILIYLVLCAQYESFRDPLVILISVPMSICGALIPLFLGIGDASMNIYTQVGLMTLIGLISKHGILMVDFANQLQISKGYSIRKAIEEAAAIRLRPILMTTAAMVFGIMPLVFATGAGAASRYNMGIVISVGLSIGTLFTLFVVPAFYSLIARNHAQRVKASS